MKKKTIVKVSILAIVVAAVAAIIIGALKTGTPPPPPPPDKTDYLEYMKRCVNDSIKPDAVDYSKAKEVYNHMSRDLEADKTMYDPDTLREAGKILANAYAPKMVAYAKSYFRNTSWEGTKVAALGNEAETLVNSGFIEEGSPMAHELNEIKLTVSDYKRAVAFVNRASGGCTTAAAVRSVKNEAANVKTARISACTSLIAQINAAGSKAHNSYNSYVEGLCQSFINKCSNPLQNFNSADEPLYQRDYVIKPKMQDYNSLNGRYPCSMTSIDNSANKAAKAFLR